MVEEIFTGISALLFIISAGLLTYILMQRKTIKLKDGELDDLEEAMEYALHSMAFESFEELTQDIEGFQACMDGDQELFKAFEGGNEFQRSALFRLYRVIGTCPKVAPSFTGITGNDE